MPSGRALAAGFDTGLLLFVADELIDRDAGSARKTDRMAEEGHTPELYPAMNGCI